MAFSLPAFVVGSTTGIYLVTSTRLSLWRKDDALAREYLDSASGGSRTQTSDRHLFFGPAARRWMVTQWNNGVDRLAKPLIADLAEKGW